MTDTYELFQRFKSALHSGADRNSLILGNEGGYAVYYVPFEYVNAGARLALVGITPGPDQVKCAYSSAHTLLRSAATDSDVLREIKRSCAFSGMRQRINEMLDHFRIPRCIGVTSAASLWETDFLHLQPASIVPNAAFNGEAYFNGPFSAVLSVPLLLRQFEGTFIPSISSLSKETLYVSMGPVVDEALRWCAKRGVIAERQILGYFPHASGRSGSQFDYFMRRKRVVDLKPKDPVRHRVRDLDRAYQMLTLNIKALFPTLGQTDRLACSVSSRKAEI